MTEKCTIFFQFEEENDAVGYWAGFVGDNLADLDTRNKVKLLRD